MFTKILYKLTKFEKKQIRIKNRKFSMFIADSLSRGSVGLMYRPKIKSNEGMFFTFPFEHKWKIWMLNMRFPLDVIWLDKEWRVVHMEKNMQPCKNFFSCKAYVPKAKSKYVLELGSGQIKKLKIKEGEKLKL
jgi:uncharacterized membrane protein (UPF0127 family)